MKNTKVLNISALVIILFLVTFTSKSVDKTKVEKETIFDFGTDKAGASWFVMNDDVMGGHSEGKMQLNENSLQFTGTISLKNNGGYSFVRKPYGSLNLGDAKKVIIRYRAKNQTMALNLNNSKAWYRPYYKLMLPDTDDEWKTLELNLSESIIYSSGKPTKETMPLELVSTIKRIGFSNADLKEGPFSFEVDYLIIK